MIEEFDKMIGEALIENFEELLEYEEGLIRKLEQEARNKWQRNRTDEEWDGGHKSREGSK